MSSGPHTHAAHRPQRQEAAHSKGVTDKPEGATSVCRVFAHHPVAEPHVHARFDRPLRHEPNVPPASWHVEQR